MSGQSGRALMLGVVDYGDAWRLQRRLVAARQQGLIEDTLVLLEHPHTYTFGRRAVPEHLLLDEAGLRERGIATYWIDRGGYVTYHGPGQIVGYPILNLRHRGLDVHQYLRALEEAIIRLLSRHGIEGERDPAYTGVWTSAGKVAAIGIKVSRGVSSHGFALNVNTDLSYFCGIIPCGIADRPVASMAALLGRELDLQTVRADLLCAFAEVFGPDWQSVDPAALEPQLPPLESLEPLVS